MSVRAIEAEVSIKSGVQAECTIGREVIVEVHEEAVLEPLTVTTNGSYEPSEGVDGFSDVTVSVPERIPVTESLSVTENGTYEPSEGVDGFNSVTVNVEAPQDPNVIEGEFIGTETGVLTIDTGYEGDGCPRIITIYADGQIQSDEFLENELSYSMNVYSCVKRSPSATSYPTGNALNSQCYTFYVYKNGENAYNIGYSTTVLVLSRTDPEYGSSKILRFNDARTMKVWCASELSDTATFFAVGVKYKYRIVYR